MTTGGTPLWVIDGNNVFGSRPDGWWNDRTGAAFRFAQCVAEWCRTHDDEVVVVFDAPVKAENSALAGGNLAVVEATRRGRDAADDEIVAMLDRLDPVDLEITTVVTSDRGLRNRIPQPIEISGTKSFRHLIGY